MIDLLLNNFKKKVEIAFFDFVDFFSKEENIFSKYDLGFDNTYYVIKYTNIYTYQ